METDVDAHLRRRYERQIADIEIVEKEDLDLVSHKFIILCFISVNYCIMIRTLEKVVLYVPYSCFRMLLKEFCCAVKPYVVKHMNNLFDIMTEKPSFWITENLLKDIF